MGNCILYALSCNLSDSALVNQHDLLVQSKNGTAADGSDDDPAEDDESDDTGDGGSGAKVKLKPWHRRQGRSLGQEGPGGRPAPLIDQVHRLMHLWRAGDQVRVNEYPGRPGAATQSAVPPTAAGANRIGSHRLPTNVPSWRP